LSASEDQGKPGGFELEPDSEEVVGGHSEPQTPQAHDPEAPDPEPEPTAEPATDSEDDPDVVLEEIHPDPDGPSPSSRLTQAREARELADAVSSDAYKALWLDVVKWPLRGSTVPAVLLLLLVAGGLSYFDGGTPDANPGARGMMKVAIGTVGLAVLGLYARRIIFNAVQGDRRLPWFRDPDDDMRWWTAVFEFVTVATLTLLPLAAFWVSQFFVEYGEWTGRLVASALCLLGAAQLPLALVGTTLRGTVFAAFPWTVARVWRAEPHASRVAAVTSVTFVSLLLLSFAFAAGLDPAADDHSAQRTAGRIGLTALRFLALYSALVSFRVAGLLVHEVPEVREALKR
jgi:hypothetical protein